MLSPLLGVTLTGAMALAGSVSAEGPSEDFATAQTQRMVPKGVEVTDTTCTKINVGMSIRYRCTMTFKN